MFSFKIHTKATKPNINFDNFKCVFGFTFQPPKIDFKAYKIFQSYFSNLILNKGDSHPDRRYPFQLLHQQNKFAHII